MAPAELNSSQETIKEDANRQAKTWKERRGMGSPKIHTAKLPKYLEIWDAIEGWTGAGYDITREQIYEKVASSTKKSISTIHDHHNAVFHAIIGVKFSPTVWWNTMGRYKLASFNNEEQKSHLWIARHRLDRVDQVIKGSYSQSSQPMRSPSSGDPLIAVNNLEVDAPEKVLYEQILEKIRVGKSVEQIRDELKLVDAWSEKLILYLQKRVNTMASASK